MKKRKWKAVFLATVLSLSSVLSSTAFAATEAPVEGSEQTVNAVPYLLRTAQTEQYENHIVDVWLELNAANSENIASYQLSLQLTNEDGEAMSGATMNLQFDEALNDAKVKEAQFDSETQSMDIYVASTKNLVQIEDNTHKLPIGQITVNAAEGEQLNQFKIVIKGETGNLITVGTDHVIKNVKELYDDPEFKIPSDGTVYGLPVEYPLTIQATNGTVHAYVVEENITEDGTITTEQTPVQEKVKKHETVLLKAIPNKGYRLKNIRLENTLNPDQEVKLSGNFTFDMTGVITVTAEFEELPGIKVTVGENATISGKEMDENHSATFQSREVATVSAIVPEGKKFSHWTDQETDAIVSYDQTYKFVVINSVTLIPVFVDIQAEVEEQPMAVLDAEGTIEEFPAGSGKYRLSYSGKTTVPEGYTVVERGLLLTNQKVDENNQAQFVLNGTINGVKVATMKVAFGGEQFIVNVNNVKTGQTRVGRAYVTYKDKEGQMHTIYSESYVTLTTETL